MSKLKIVTWNVNSIKSRLGHLIAYLESTQAPDILLLQELKCTTDNFPFLELEHLGYNIVAHGQKTYNGVAILSKLPIDDTIIMLPGDESDIQARYIEATLSSSDGKALRVASVYVPNGQQVGSEKFTYKLNFLERLKNHINSLLSHEEIMIIGGDYNVAPAPIDVYAPKQLDGTICFHKEERAAFRRIINCGVVDAYRKLNPEQEEYSWWDYRGGSWQHNKGMRIDHLLLSPEASDLLESSYVDKHLRELEKPSDHAPVACELKL